MNKSVNNWVSMAALFVLVLAMSGAGTGLSEPSRAAAQVELAWTQTGQSRPLMFIENTGQWDGRARFQVQRGDQTIWLAEDGLWITVVEHPRSGDLLSIPPGSSRVVPLAKQVADLPARGVAIQLAFVGADPQPVLEPFSRMETSVSYFTSRDPAQWQTNVPVWRGVRYKNLYPGVDLEIASQNGLLLPRLTARPGAVVDEVRLQVMGADQATLLPSSRAGGLAMLGITTPLGELTFPLLAIDSSATARAASIQKVRSHTFEITFPLTFAPELSETAFQAALPSDLLYATYLGGSGGDDDGSAIAVDESGSAYVMGVTSAPDFPTTPGAYDLTYAADSRDIFVTKLSPAGSSLIYSTFLGGDLKDYGFDIAVDESGSAYVTGWSMSANFPTTPGAYSPSLNGTSDAFVTKLNPTGSALVYSTFLGGGEGEDGKGIAVDANGNAYVTGVTQSPDFPTTPVPFHPFTHAGDVFVTKLNPTGSDLLYSTILGREGYGYDIAVDESGSAYVTGYTWSPDFLTTPGAYDRTFSGIGDAFVAKLGPSGSERIYATFLGGGDTPNIGGDDDSGYGIAVDAKGSAYVTGVTYSSDFPTTLGAYDLEFNGEMDAFVTRLNTTGSGLIYSTFLGGAREELGYGFAIDKSGCAYVTGFTSSEDYPTTFRSFDPSFNAGEYDAYLTKLNPNGSSLLYSTFLGGSGVDYGGAAAVDASGGVYLTGNTASTDFPTTPGAFDQTFTDYRDAYVAKLATPDQAPFVFLPVIYR